MKPRVLVVDDNSLILGCFTAILEADDFEVQAVGSAREAEIALGQSEFDLVITDLDMETPTAGYEVVQAARAQLYQPEVVILTAFPVPNGEWKRRGAKALFVKGAQAPNRLIANIRAILADALAARNSA